MKLLKSSPSALISMAIITGGLALTGVALLALVLDTSLPGWEERPWTLNLAVAILLTQHVIFLCLLRARNWISEKMTGGESEKD